MDMVKGQNGLLSNRSLLLQMDWKLSEPASMDIDPSLFLLDADEKVTEDKDFIFYNQPTSHKGQIQYVADESLRDGKAGFLINLDALPDTITNIAIVVTCDASQDSESLKGLEWAILDIQTPNGSSIIQYTFHNDAQDETAMIVGMIYRHKTDWKFRAIGQGFVGGLLALATHFGVDVAAPLSSPAEPEVTLAPPATTTEQSTLLEAQAQLLKCRLEPLLADIASTCKTQENETKTRMVLDRIFQEVLGYHMENINPEQDVQGRRADYVLSVDGKNVLVVEVKRAGMPLRDRQIFQATAYGAYAGIRWALLTNLMEWQLYRVSTHERVEAHLVFTVNLRNGLSMDSAYHLALISYDGFRQKDGLEKLYRKINVLSYESLVVALLHQKVVGRIRAILSHQAGQDLTHEEVRTAIERNVLHL